MKKIFYFLLFSILFFEYGNSFAQVPAYQLYAKSFVEGPANKLTFEIRVQSIDASTIFEYAGGEYYLYFNPDIANGGTITPEIIASELPVNLRPVNPSIISADGFPIVIKLGLNTFPGPGNGYIIPALFPGKLIARVRLTTSASSFKFKHVHLGTELFVNPEWRDAPDLIPSTKIFAYVGTNDSNITSPKTHTIETGVFNYCGTILQLRVLEEGLYNASLNILNKKDSIKIYVRSKDFPFSLIDSAKGAMDTVSLFGTFYFPNMPTGVYYIVVKHLNSLETWGLDTLKQNVCNGLGELFTNTFDFSTSQSQAYGNNLVLKGSKYCLYNGDVDQNGVIDLADIILIYNDARNFVTGNVNTDLNGDNIVDLEDLLIAKNNSDNFVIAITPL